MTLKVPGPDHPITVVPNPRRVVVRLDGRTIADTRNALTLTEASYPPVQYFPRIDVDMTRLVRTDHATTCPFKGEAGYYSIRKLDGSLVENAVWTYETPHDAVAAIASHLAFYPNEVDAIEDLDD